MVVVPTDKIRSGQILADEVRDINGRLLLSKGREIGAKHIRIFKIWGVTEVKLAAADPGDDGPDPKISPEILEQKKESLKVHFRYLDPLHPAVDEILRIAARFRSEHNIETGIGNSPSCQSDVKRPILQKDILKELHRKKIVLPEIPSIAFELNGVIRDPESSAEHIAQVVTRSPSLTAVLLRIVNSALYALPAKISTVSHAVSLLGSREISGLALGISILSVFKNIPQKTIDMVSFMRHSLACGILSRVLAAHKNIPQTEQMFISGLLHDLGRLVLYSHFPDESRTVLIQAENCGTLLFEEEKRALGCDHARVAGQLMQQWKLPMILEDLVSGHHLPSKARQPLAATIVHLADIIVNALGLGSSGEKFVPPLDYDAWEILEFSPSGFESVIGQAMHQFQGLESILDA